MILLRKEAVRLAAFLEMFELPKDKQKFYIESALLEEGVQDVSEATEYQYLRDYVEHGLKSVTNQYLQLLISKHLDVNVCIEGEQPILLKCPCCGYLTLEERGHYEICEVCFWEDHGGEDKGDEYSPPNRMTLGEGRRNFLEHGVCKERLLEHLHPDRMLMYSRA